MPWRRVHYSGLTELRLTYQEWKEGDFVILKSSQCTPALESGERLSNEIKIFSHKADMYGFEFSLLDLFGLGVLPNVHSCYYGPWILEYRCV